MATSQLSDKDPASPHPDRDAGAPKPHDANAGRTSTASSATASDAELLLDMKLPANDPEETEPQLESRSILNAATDSSDGEDEGAGEPETSDAVVDDVSDEPGVRPSPEAAPPTVNNDNTTTENDEEEDVLPPVHGEKGIEYSLNDLFVNPNLRKKSANVVLKKDPFAIPRATDNVTEYRPRFNPLNILMAEEKLLPRNFKFDFTEGIPGEPKQETATALGKRGSDVQGRTSRTNSDFDASTLLVRKSVPPVRNPQVFGDKLSTMGLLMGSMPRQPQPSPTPLINTPTVHNPFGEPLLELVATSEPPSAPELLALQRLRAAPSTPAAQQQLPIPLTPVGLTENLGAEFDAFGIDLHNISNLSKLSIAANVASAETPAPFNAAYSPYGDRSLPMESLPQQPLVYDGLASYLPNHFAENRIPPPMSMDASLYEVSAFQAENAMNEEDYRNSFGESYTAGGHTSASTPAHSDYESQRDSVGSSQTLQPVAKKTRSKNVFRPCTTPGCTKGARGKSGLCQKHGGGKRCATPDCPKGAQGSSKYCLFHGGGYRCTVPGCTTGARGTSGLCAKHGGYKRFREGSDDGQGEERRRSESGHADKKPRVEFEGRALEAAG